MPIAWPELDVARDQPTFATLHLVSQMLGKLRVTYSPWVNHGWNVTLRPRPDGLAIEPTMAGDVSFELMLDLCRHQIAPDRQRRPPRCRAAARRQHRRASRRPRGDARPPLPAA